MRSRPVRLLIAYVLAVAFLCVSAFFVAGDRADAHNPNAYAYWNCSVHRSDPSATVIHSEIFAVYPNIVRYRCLQDVHFFGVVHAYYVDESPAYSGNSVRVGGYQNCYLVVCWAH